MPACHNLTPQSVGAASATPDPAAAERLERLGEIAGIIDLAHHRAPGRPTSLVRLGGIDGDDIDLGLLPVEPGDVLDLLLGSTTPPRWDAMGIVVHGTARALEGHDASSPIGPGRVMVTFLCGRDGGTASVVRPPEGEPHAETAGPGAGPVGRMADALRRSLGVATAAPTAPAALAMAHLWLHRVHETALRGHGAPLGVGVVDALRPAGPATWAELREQCAHGSWVELGCPPDLAEWMDDGMFSRWCSANFPEPIEVLVELSELIAPDAAEHLADALAATLDHPGRADGRR